LKSEAFKYLTLPNVIIEQSQITNFAISAEVKEIKGQKQFLKYLKRRKLRSAKHLFLLGL